MSNNVSEQLNKNTRETRRTRKYRRKIDTSAQKLTPLPSASVEMNIAGGQVTGKFMSLNEPAIRELAAKSRQLNVPSTVDYSVQLKTDRSNGRYSNCSSLTASSYESPVRADARVQRAAELAAKTYLEDVTNMVSKVNKQPKTFAPALLKNAHQEINGRQCARLEYIKA